jgi:AraC family transcriptional regulator of arabinose operon
MHIYGTGIFLIVNLSEFLFHHVAFSLNYASKNSCMNTTTKDGSIKNVWHGTGRQRIEIPKAVLKAQVLNNKLLQTLYIGSLGYYPQARGHFTYRKKGLAENFIFYCVDGHGWYKIENERYEVGPNEFFILPQNKEHAYGSDETRPWSIYWIHFGGTSLPDFNTMQIVRDHFKPAYIKASDTIVALFNKIYQTLETGYSIDNLTFSNLCLSHYLTLFLYNAKHFDASVTKSDIISDAIRHMQENINSNITLQDLCSHFHYSPSRFSSLFKQRTGYSPIDYFIQLKMQKASQLLDFTDQSIKDVAFTFGFDDPYYFSRRFRKTIGVSPKKYRSIKKD